MSWLQRLAPQLMERGIEVRCLFILHWGDTGPALRSLRAAGITCSVTGAERTEDRIEWILDELRKNPPDVFVPNLVVAAYHASRWVREAGIPTVGILHSDDPFYHALVAEFVTGPTKRRVSALVCVSDELSRMAMQIAPRDVDVQRIPYGVDIPERSVNRVDSRLRLAYVGRLAEEQKRIGDVVRALCAATAQLEGVEATIYGDGPDRDVVVNVIRRDGEGLPVHLAGLISSEQIQDRLLGADAIVLLSDYEGLPISLLEAMACGCVPIVSEMRSGIPELIGDRVTGLIVRDRNTSFINAVRLLRDDQVLWEQISQNARTHVKHHYASDASTDRWADLIQTLWAKSQKTGAIASPRRFRLPRVNPALLSADQRLVKRGWPEAILSGLRSKVQSMLGRQNADN